MDGFALGWRDGILLLAALAAVYLVMMLLKLTQVGRARQARVADMTPRVDAPLASVAEAAHLQVSEETDVPVEFRVPSVASAIMANVEELPRAVPPAPTFEWNEVDDLLPDTRDAGDGMVPVAQTAAPRGGGFGQHLAEHLARSDMEMEVQRMRDEMERMRTELAELRVARRVSPQYAEAMELSQRGLTAQDVADHLGISLAEAELVYALSRGDKNFDEGVEHGEDRYVASGEFTEFGGRRVGGR